MYRIAASRLGPQVSKRALSTAAPSMQNVVVVSGVRLPFSMTSTIYQNELAVDLQRLAIHGLLTETALPKEEVDYVISGNVIQEVRTSNIAREAAINAGLPISIGAHTIAQVREIKPDVTYIIAYGASRHDTNTLLILHKACISANAAICAGAEKIMTGHADVVIAGGTEVRLTAMYIN